MQRNLSTTHLEVLDDIMRSLSLYPSLFIALSLTLPLCVNISSIAPYLSLKAEVESVLSR